MNIIYSDRDFAVIIKPVGVDSEHQVPAMISEQLGGGGSAARPTI